MLSPGAYCPWYVLSPGHTVPASLLQGPCRTLTACSIVGGGTRAWSASPPRAEVCSCAWKLPRSARTCQLSPCRWSGRLPQSPRSEQGSVPTAVPLASKSPLPQPTTPESPRQHLLHPSNSFRVSVVLRPPVRSGATAVSQPDPVPGYSALTGQSAASWSRGFTSIWKQAESDLHSAPV